MSILQTDLISFDQLVGQSALTARLSTALHQGRVAHAVIIAGPRGSGKRTLANIYARALVCQGEGVKPCNSCPSCRRALGGNHPDLHVVKPEEEGKALGVDEARGVLRLIDLKPYEGGRAVVTVTGAHGMTVQAQNALLKTLEEPPEHVVLMLLAETLSPLLPTILSRCAVYKMRRLKPAEVLAVLLRHGHAEDLRTLHAAAMADGSPGRALALLADESYWTLRDRAMAALEQLVAGRKLAAAMKFAQENRNRAQEVLTIWECAVRDAAVAAAGARSGLLTGEAKGFLKAAGAEALERRLAACVEARRALDGNAIYTMTMDRLLIELAGGI